MAAVVALLVAAWLLSVLGSVVAFSGFTVTREGDRLRIRRGLLARREATVPVERVRAVEVVEGVLRLPFGLAALRMEVIGHAKEAAAAQTLFPLLRRDEVRGVPRRAAARAGRRPRRARAPAGPRRPALRAAAGRARRPGRRAARVGVHAGRAVGAARRRCCSAATGCCATAPPAGGWTAAGSAIRSLRLARTTVLGPARYREWHELSQNPLQRRGRLADVFVAFGKQTRRPRAPPRGATADALYDRLSRL